jgi:hypothetical protein
LPLAASLDSIQCASYLPLQFVALLEQREQLTFETFELVVDGFCVAGFLFDADIPTRREHILVARDLIGRHRGAEPQNVGICAGVWFPAPRVIGVGDPAKFLVAELSVGTVNHHAEVATLDE